jgi:iron complex outermembrane receptor protein
MKNWKQKFLLGTLTLLFFVSPVLPAMAEEAQQELEKKEGVKEKVRAEYELEVMTVTAEKREEKIQEVPVSITVLSDIQIEDSGIVSIKDIALQIPNLHIVKTNNRYHTYLVGRGTGSVTWGGESPMGFFVDDVPYFMTSTIDTGLFDIERIEVLRGPQGTLYGRNTEAGVVNIITKKPGNQLEGRASVGYGNYDSQDYRVSIRGPMLKDKLFFGVSGVKNKRDGYTENDCLGGELDDRDTTSGRVKLGWMPTDTLDITLTAAAERFRDGAKAVNFLDQVRHHPHHANYDYKGFLDQDTNDQALRVAYETPWFKVTSITARRDKDFEYDDDSDFTSVDLFRGYQKEDETYWTQELRIQSRKDFGALKWLLGGYYFDGDFDKDVLFDIRQAVPEMGVPAPTEDWQLSELDVRGHAIFGQATYTLFEKLGITAGLRYDYEEKENKWQRYMEMMGMRIPVAELETDANWTEWMPKFAVDYRWTPKLMAYVSVAKGYKSGGFNYAVDTTSDVSYDPEYSWNYEVGIKSSWLDNRLIANLAAFYIDSTDRQVGQISAIAANQVIIRNAAETYSQGFELELVARPAAGLDFIAGFGYTEAKYDDYKDPVIGTSYDDNLIPVVPEYTYNLAVQYRHPTGLFGRVDLQGIGDMYWDNANTQKEDAHEIVNARLGYEGEYKGFGFDMYLWAKNLFDEEYADGVFAYLGDLVGSAGDPQTFGITLTARF